MASASHTHPPGVMLYSGFYEALKGLPLDMVGALTIALMEYNMFGTVPQLEGIAAFAWAFIKDYADHDNQRYQQQVERRRAAAEKRWSGEGGSKMGNKMGGKQPSESERDGAEWMLKYMNQSKNSDP